MDSLVTIVTSLWGCVSPGICRLVELENTLEALEPKIQSLVDMLEDVTKRVLLEEEQQMRRRRLKEVEGWLEEKKVLVREATETVGKGRQELQSRCLWGRCPKNCLSSYRIARNLEKKLAEVKEALERGKFENVTYELRYLSGEARPEEETVGHHVIFQEAWRWITDENIGIVGLYGVGGVGKTTLLAKIHNELIKASASSSSSKLVIWVTVNRSATVEEVQQVIHNRLNLKDENWDRRKTDEKCSVICQFLSGKQFVLLLDDLWERLDLSKVGIPLPGLGGGDKNMVKIAFTTRSKKLCSEMRADKIIEVTCLPLPEGKALFNATVGEETLSSNPEIPKIAEAMATYCGGLPIALITIGRAMSGKRELGAWRRAKRFMRESLSRITSMSSEVYPLLRLSYDSLSDETNKQCFLYCALFSPGFEIPTEVLIRCWVDEGILHEYDDNRNTEASASASTLASNQRSEITDDDEDDIHWAMAMVMGMPGARVPKSACLLERSFDYSDIRVSRWASEQGLEIIESLKSACLLERGVEYENCVKMHDVIRDMALWIIHQEGKFWDKSRKARIEREISIRAQREFRGVDSEIALALRRGMEEYLIDLNKTAKYGYVPR